MAPADVEGAARGLCWGEGECEMEVPPASGSVEHDDAPAASHSGTGESLPQLGMERSPEAPEFELEVLGSPPKRREEVDDLFMDLLDD